MDASEKPHDFPDSRGMWALLVNSHAASISRGCSGDKGQSALCAVRVLLLSAAFAVEQLV